MLIRWLLRESLDHSHKKEDIEARLRRTAGNPSFLRDAVYGGIDGAITTFAIVAGVQGAGFDSHIIVALGVANVLADGFSMAASNYSGIKADSDNVDRLRSMEERHIVEFPEGERLEIQTILANKGLSGRALDEAVAVVTSHKPLWLDMMLVEEHGVSTVPSAPLRAAIVTFAAFFVCGLVPLLPFVLDMESAFLTSIVATGFTFALIGSVKSRWSLKSWWASALQTLSIGAAAALIAWSAAMFITRL